MTTFKVSIPEDKISSFKTFLETLGVDYTELDSQFELSEEQKKLLNEIDKISLSEYTSAETFFSEIRKEYGL